MLCMRDRRIGWGNCSRTKASKLPRWCNIYRFWETVSYCFLLLLPYIMDLGCSMNSLISLAYSLWHITGIISWNKVFKIQDLSSMTQHLQRKTLVIALGNLATHLAILWLCLPFHQPGSGYTSILIQSISQVNLFSLEWLMYLSSHLVHWWDSADFTLDDTRLIKFF